MSHVPLTDRIRDFVLLTDRERAHVLEEVSRRPDLAADVEEAQALAAVFDAASRPEEALVGLVDVRLGHRAVPPLAPEAEAAEVNARLDLFESECEPPLAEFERLTGIALTRRAPEAQGIQANGLAHTNGHSPKGVSSNGHLPGAALGLVADRPPVPRQKAQTVRPLARRVVFTALGLVALYGAVFSVSAWQTPEHVRVADIGDVSESFRPLRGQNVSDQYAEAVETLSQAHTSTLGLFPRYDGEGLDSAAEAFARIARAESEGHYGQEAALAIGRIRLLQGDQEAARIALESVVAHSGYRAPEATKLLDYIDAHVSALE